MRLMRRSRLRNPRLLLRLSLHRHLSLSRNLRRRPNLSRRQPQRPNQRLSLNLSQPPRLSPKPLRNRLRRLHQSLWLNP
jgi:hypothetical protein